MQDTSALARILALVRDLRKRCPWDAAQTPATLRPYLVEEVMELDHALGAGDARRIREELGDLMLHLAFQLVLAEERHDFTSADVAAEVEAKMWRRHPHLFPAAAGNRPPAPAGGASSDSTHAASWERTKRAEAGASPGGVLDGLPPNLPELIMALRLQERAAGVGFDWPGPEGPLAKVSEELAELRAELGGEAAGRETPVGDAHGERVEHELGDLLFSLVNLARKLGHDPRAALERANRRFVARFQRMEQIAAARGLDVGSAGLEALDGLWDQAKAES